MKTILRNAGIFSDGNDFSRVLNSIELNYETDPQDVTSFGAGAREFLPGMPGYRFAAAGFYDPLYDEVMFAQAQDSDSSKLLSIVADNAVGGVSYFFRGASGQYQFSGSVGGAATISLSGQTKLAPVVRGKLLARTTPTVTATGSGTAVLFESAVAASQSIYGALHVVSVTGTSPTLVVKIQSDDNSGFTSPIDRLTFTSANATGSQWASASPGAITDTYWRAIWTVGGTSPAFGFAVSFGFI